jgi:poly(A) polymerase
MLALRMERGPLGAEEAEAELRRWAAENGVPSDPNPEPDRG